MFLGGSKEAGAAAGMPKAVDARGGGFSRDNIHHISCGKSRLVNAEGKTFSREAWTPPGLEVPPHSMSGSYKSLIKAPLSLGSRRQTTSPTVNLITGSASLQVKD